MDPRDRGNMGKEGEGRVNEGVPAAKTTPSPATKATDDADDSTLARASSACPTNGSRML